MPEFAKGIMPFQMSSHRIIISWCLRFFYTATTCLSFFDIFRKREKDFKLDIFFLILRDFHSLDSLCWSGEIKPNKSHYIKQISAGTDRILYWSYMVTLISLVHSVTLYFFEYKSVKSAWSPVSRNVFLTVPHILMKEWVVLVLGVHVCHKQFRVATMFLLCHYCEAVLALDSLVLQKHWLCQAVNNEGVMSFIFWERSWIPNILSFTRDQWMLGSQFQLCLKITYSAAFSVGSLEFEVSLWLFTSLRFGVWLKEWGPLVISGL